MTLLASCQKKRAGFAQMIGLHRKFITRLSWCFGEPTSLGTQFSGPRWVPELSFRTSLYHHVLGDFEARTINAAKSTAKGHQTCPVAGPWKKLASNQILTAAAMSSNSSTIHVSPGCPGHSAALNGKTVTECHTITTCLKLSAPSGLKNVS